MNRIRSVAVCSALAVILLAGTSRALDIDRAVKKVEATFEPAEAKPGQVVTLKIRVELDTGWWTYPTVQTDKAAANQINKFVFPKEGSLLFVGKPIDPTNPKSKPEPDLGIEKLLYYPGGGTYEHKVVVSPKAGKGEAEAKVTVKLTVCNTMNCVPGKYDVTAKLKVLDGPAVEVDSTYKAEVEKLLGK